MVFTLAATFMTLAIAGPTASIALQVKGYVVSGYELRKYSFGPFSFETNINPVESATIDNFTLDDGNVILTPIDNDLCRLSFPVCRLYPNPIMQFRGD